MNKAKTFKDWVEGKKHLQGQHSQGAHGRRGGGAGTMEKAKYGKAADQATKALSGIEAQVKGGKVDDLPALRSTLKAVLETMGSKGSHTNQIDGETGAQRNKRISTDILSMTKSLKTKVQNFKKNPDTKFVDHIPNILYSYASIHPKNSTGNDLKIRQWTIDKMELAEWLF